MAVCGGITMGGRSRGGGELRARRVWCSFVAGPVAKREVDLLETGAAVRKKVLPSILYTCQLGDAVVPADKGHPPQHA